MSVYIFIPNYDEDGVYLDAFYKVESFDDLEHGSDFAQNIMNYMQSMDKLTGSEEAFDTRHPGLRAKVSKDVSAFTSMTLRSRFANSALHSVIIDGELSRDELERILSNYQRDGVLKEFLSDSRV